MKIVEVTYTLGDWHAATFQSWRHYAARILILFGILGLVLVALPVVLDGESLVDVLRWFPWGFLLGVAAFLLLFFMGACPLISFIQVKRQKALGPNRFSLSEEGLRFEGPKGQSLIYWASLKRVTASKDRLFLFIGPALAYVLPTRVFPDRASFEATVEEARARWSAANQ